MASGLWLWEAWKSGGPWGRCDQCCHRGAVSPEIQDEWLKEGCS